MQLDGTALAFLHGERSDSFVVGSAAGGVHLFNARSPKTPKLFAWDQGHSDRVHTILVGTGSANNSIVTASDDSLVKLWTVGRPASVRTFAGHDGRTTTVAMHREGDLLASAGIDRFLKIWDRSSRDPIFSVPTDQEVVSLSFPFDDPAKLLIAGSGVAPRILDLRMHASYKHVVLGNEASPASSADAATSMGSGGTAAAAVAGHNPFTSELRAITRHTLRTGAPLSSQYFDKVGRSSCLWHCVSARTTCLQVDGNPATRCVVLLPPN